MLVRVIAATRKWLNLGLNREGVREEKVLIK